MGVWIGVGRPFSLVRNDIVTAHHFISNAKNHRQGRSNPNSMAEEPVADEILESDTKVPHPVAYFKIQAHTCLLVDLLAGQLGVFFICLSSWFPE